MSDGQTPDEGTIRYLSLAQILAAADLDEDDVVVPEWGGKVRIKGFTKARQQELRRQAIDPGTTDVNTDRLEMFLFIEGVIDNDTKQPLATAENYEQLRGKSAAAMDRVLKAIAGITGSASGGGGELSSHDEAARSFRP